MYEVYICYVQSTGMSLKTMRVVILSSMYTVHSDNA